MSKRVLCVNNEDHFKKKAIQLTRLFFEKKPSETLLLLLCCCKKLHCNGLAWNKNIRILEFFIDVAFVFLFCFFKWGNFLCSYDFFKLSNLKNRCLSWKYLYANGKLKPFSNKNSIYFLKKKKVNISNGLQKGHIF